jgi:hypothetical protein
VENAATFMPACAMAGSMMPRPAASAVTSIFQPLPTPASPPITRLSGMNTSLPVVGPLGKACIPG